MSEAEPLIVYGFWRSNATYRVRVALNLKGVAYREIPVDLEAGEQSEPAFLARNPFGAVPALIGPDGVAITQSLAILEYLDELHPEPPLLPQDPRGRALVRALAADVACDSHPLITTRIKSYLTDAGFDAAAYRAWQGHWISAGLAAIEARLAASRDTGRFCFGDRVTIADICVSGLLLLTRLFRFETPPVPTVARIAETCWALDAFRKADPMAQADAPRPA